ncbi:MAG: ribokinase [Lachnospiraceae bacterium]|nr:ribokinase [Lachnospiraceae bacterium]
MRILNWGSMNLDYVYKVDHFVLPGETISASSQSINPGGKGLNQSIALSRAGAKVYHAGAVGKNGGQLKQLLDENGVDTGFIRELDVIQGNAIIQVTAAGENNIIIYGGSNRCMTREHIDQVLASFDKGDYLLVQNEVNEVGYIIEKAFARGMTVVLNPSPYNDSLKDIDYSKVSWLLVNEVEAFQISGEKDPEKAWEFLHSKYPELSCVITLGSEGCAAYQTNPDDYEKQRQPAIKVEARDTTAAGDTFTGYFISSVMKGQSLKDSIFRATVASSISVTREGAAKSIPNDDEVESACSRP